MRFARRRTAIRADRCVHMVEPSAESHGLSMQLAQVRADLEGSQKRSPKVCAPQARPHPKHSASHGPSAQPSQRYSCTAAVPPSISRMCGCPPAPRRHALVRAQSDADADPHGTILRWPRGLINHARRHCCPAPANQCPPSSRILPLLSHPCCTLAPAFKRSSAAASATSPLLDAHAASGTATPDPARRPPGGCP